MSKKYSTADIARTLEVSERTVRRKLSKHLNLQDGKYEVSELFFEFLKQNSGFADTSADNVRTPEDNLRKTEDIMRTTEESQEPEYDIIEGFSAEEYQEFQKRLVEYPLLKDHLATIMNELEYHRKSGESKDRQMEKILANIQQRNFIEAKDKKIE